MSLSRCHNHSDRFYPDIHSPFTLVAVKNEMRNNNCIGGNDDRYKKIKQSGICFNECIVQRWIETAESHNLAQAARQKFLFKNRRG